MKNRLNNLIMIGILSIFIVGCNVKTDILNDAEKVQPTGEISLLERESEGNSEIIKENVENEEDEAQEIIAQEKHSWINSEGGTIEERILLPDGFERLEVNSYGEYIRELPLLSDGSPVYLYDGSEKANQDVHVAVLDIDVGEKDLQQCADAALRIRCEFLYQEGEFEQINYQLTNGDEFPYSAYREGYRLQVDGNKTSMVKTADIDDSYECFRNYLNVLYTYAGTLSVQAESTEISKEAMEIGDIFIIGGSPGHCVMVMDICENEAGEVNFLLGQSYMPAQQIHILKNPNSKSPWYSVNKLDYPFKTPEWTFEEKCLRRMP